MSELPETILQFGSGKFLRGFADLFIHQANQGGRAVGRVVVAQSTGEERANLLNRQGGLYHVVVRGLAEGSVVDEVQEVHSVSRALVAARQWNEVLAVARAPELRYVVSNTAEVGYNLDPADRAGAYLGHHRGIPVQVPGVGRVAGVRLLQGAALAGCRKRAGRKKSAHNHQPSQGHVGFHS